MGLLAAGLPSITLAELLPQLGPSRLNVRAVDGLIGREGVASLVEQAQVTDVDLAEAARALKQAAPGNQVRLAALDYYREALAAALHRPDADAIQQEVQSQLGKEAIEHISAAAMEGLYILLNSEMLTAEDVASFLGNPAIASLPGGANQILTTLSELFHHGIKGYPQLLLSDGSTKQLLSRNQSRLQSVCDRMNYALLLSRCSQAQVIYLNRTFPFEWNDLSRSEQNYFRAYVLPNLSEKKLRIYRTRSNYRANLLVTEADQTRLVKIRSFYRSTGFFSHTEAGATLLKAMCYGLLIKQQGLAGLEYVVTGSAIPDYLIGQLRVALDISGVPYLLRVLGDRKRIFHGGLEVETTDQAAPLSISRPLPPLPAAPIEAEPLPPEQRPFESQEAMLAYLREKLTKPPKA